jgi:hypothetical protein
VIQYTEVVCSEGYHQLERLRVVCENVELVLRRSGLVSERIADVANNFIYRRV